MTDNYKFLISQARSEWITIIGQDDALVPFAISKLRAIAKEFPLHEIITSRRSFAFWPDTLKKYGRFSFIYPIDQRKPRLTSSSRFLLKSLSGTREYSEGPQLYTGSFVKKCLIDRIKQKNCGEFFTYAIPDVSSAVNFLLNTSEFVYSPLPLFVVGTSAQSTGVAIDQTVSRSLNSNTTTMISQYFSYTELDKSTPGEGIFTSFSWYMYEAYVQTMKFHSDIDLGFNHHRIMKSALSALVYESKRSQLFGYRQKARFMEMKAEIGLSQLEINLRQLFIFLKLTSRNVYKFLGAMYLFLSRRLILSNNYDRETFSLEQLCENIYLQNTAQDFAK